MTCVSIPESWNKIIYSRLEYSCLCSKIPRNMKKCVLFIVVCEYNQMTMQITIWKKDIDGQNSKFHYLNRQYFERKCDCGWGISCNIFLCIEIIIFCDCTSNIFWINIVTITRFIIPCSVNKTFTKDILHWIYSFKPWSMIVSFKHSVFSIVILYTF